MKKVYKSKIGLGLIISINVFLVTLFIFTTFIDLYWPGSLMLLIIISIIFHMFFSTFYIIENEVLTIKSSFLYNSKIDIKTIKQIIETNNLLSSPAMSIDRLEIKYNKYDTVIISPKDKAGFIKELLDINPNIEVKYKKKNN